MTKERNRVTLALSRIRQFLVIMSLVKVIEELSYWVNKAIQFPASTNSYWRQSLN